MTDESTHESSTPPEPEPDTGSTPEEGVPADEGSTLQDVIAAYEAEGYVASFGVTPEGELRCGACSATFDPASASMASLRRMEGASDPDDMLAVVAVGCPACGAKGTATLGYGPAASPEDGDVLRALDDRRGDDGVPGHAAPHEAVGDRSASA